MRVRKMKRKRMGKSRRSYLTKSKLKMSLPALYRSGFEVSVGLDVDTRHKSIIARAQRAGEY
jgi:hypothetical protein